MPYNISQPFPLKPLGQVCIANNVFTDEQMEQIDFLEQLQDFQNGTIGTDRKDPKKLPAEHLEYRNSKISWIYPDQTSIPLFNRFTEVLQQVNLDHFRRDIQGFDAMQYTVYEEGGKYDWHWDYEMISGKYVRKISATIMVSSPDEYEGGEFELVNLGTLKEENILSIKPKRGDVIFFASWMLHRVKPITKGKRKSLVVWVMGEDRG